MDKRKQEIYEEVKNLFPEETGDKRLLYVRKDWIFPNHIDLVIKNSEIFANKYGGNIDICFYAALLHDVGLVYNRTDASSKGHEERSLEFAERILKKYNYEEGFIKVVLSCIKATDPDNLPNNINEKIVRTADAYSQYKSMHFFAKGIFFGDINFFGKWFFKKIDKNFSKIMFDDEIKELSPIYEHYKKILQEFQNRST